MRIWLPLLLLFPAACTAQRGSPGPVRYALATPRLPHSGSVVFLGDSITWHNRYTALVESYFARRHPERQIRFVNRGMRSDTASGAIERLERDVVPLQPDVVIVLLGMNDGGLKGYNRGLLRFFLHNMERLVGLLREKTQAAVILVTPTCMDPVDYKTREYNRMLAAMAAGLIRTGIEQDVPVINLFAFFRNKLIEARAATPPIQLMEDPIHPGPAGHLVIAHHLLAFLDPDAKPGTPREVMPTAASRMVHEGANIYVSPEARPALRLVPFQERFNGDTLVGEGISAPVRLFAGGQELGRFTPEQLRQGVDLNLLDLAPWVQDAKRHAQLLQERWRWTYYLWDPKELGPEALRDVSQEPMQVPVSLDEARRLLSEVKSRLLGTRRSKRPQYHFRIVP
jgi:lysophospholipase L1-like esterase